MLQEKLQAEQIKALKTGDKTTLNTLRYILSQIKNKEIEKQTELSDEEVVGVIKRVAKELRESIDAFAKGKRNDLVQEHQAQLDVVLPYLPQEISDEELKKEIQNLIAQNHLLYEKNPKALIGICIKTLKHKADPSRITNMLFSLQSP